MEIIYCAEEVSICRTNKDHASSLSVNQTTNSNRKSNDRKFYPATTSITSSLAAITSAPSSWYKLPYFSRWRLFASSQPNSTTTGLVSLLYSRGQGRYWIDLLTREVCKGLDKECFIIHCICLETHKKHHTHFTGLCFPQNPKQNSMCYQ